LDRRAGGSRSRESRGNSRATGAGIAERQPLWIEPAVAASVTRLDDPPAEVRKAVPRLVAAQQLDVCDTPAVQRLDEMLLVLHAGICRGAEQVALFFDAEVIAWQIGSVGELVEQLDAFAHECDLLGIVELETERAG